MLQVCFNKLSYLFTHVLKLIHLNFYCAQALSCFVQRCYEVIKHVVHQMSALYVASK